MIHEEIFSRLSRLCYKDVVLSFTLSDGTEKRRVGLLFPPLGGWRVDWCDFYTDDVEDIIEEEGKTTKIILRDSAPQRLLG